LGGGVARRWRDNVLTGETHGVLAEAV